MSAEFAMILGGAALPIVGLVIVYFVIRALAARPVTGAPTVSLRTRCGRCENDVPTASLHEWPDLRMWCCADCDRQLMNLFFPDPTSPDYDPELHRAYLSVYREAREAREDLARSKANPRSST